MKKFYLHNGIDQQGPFDLNDLKEKGITKDTPIWQEGLPDWTTAETIDELKEIFTRTTPPPFFAQSTTLPPPQDPPSYQSSSDQQPAPKEKNTLGIILQSIGIIAAIVMIALLIKVQMKGGGKPDTDPRSYQEKVMSVEEIERSQPTKFLTADGKYNESFWGSKIYVHGVIKNKATVASYKDAVVEVTYYSKTKTELGSETYTIYDNFPPHSEVYFELKIKNYKNVHTIGWKVIKATPN